MDDLFPGLDTVDFTPTRQAGLSRMEAFQSAMGSKYAGQRNSDLGPNNRSNVSALSPWVRTRTLVEEELVRAALDRFALSTAEKFIQEVCWRTYFKGWLEHRPGVWTEYLAARDREMDRLAGNAGLRTAYDEAIEGRTGIEGFDDWSQELVETGYLHNHARMWFASIWIFTLRLPWELGADFFLQHLMDGDAASNTCSWRWVAGLHTPGKTYLARRSNISKYTDGRFSPAGLSSEAPALEGSNPAPGLLLPGDAWPHGDVALLLTEEDMNVETLRPAGATLKGVVGVTFADDRSPHGAGRCARTFIDGAMSDALDRAAAVHGASAVRLDTGDGFASSAVDWVKSLNVDTVITGFPPTGWVKPRLDRLRGDLAEEGIALKYLKRDWDDAFWPYAKKGFFGLKKKIPSVLAELGMPV